MYYSCQEEYNKYIIRSKGISKTMTVNYRAIGKRIKLERIKNDMTQEKLAEKTGLSAPHISNVESGSTSLSLKTLIIVSNALNTSPDMLLCDNIKNAKPAFEMIISEELEDCSETEISIICDMICSLKQSLRQRRDYFIQDCYKES